jgi:hypothetical protein
MSNVVPLRTTSSQASLRASVKPSQFKRVGAFVCRTNDQKPVSVRDKLSIGAQRRLIARWSRWWVGASLEVVALCGRKLAAICTPQRIDGFAVLVDGTVQVASPAMHRDRRLVHPPGRMHAAGIARPPPLEFGDVAPRSAIISTRSR